MRPPRRVVGYHHIKRWVSAACGSDRSCVDKPGLPPRSDADAQAGIIAVTTRVTGGTDARAGSCRVEE